MMKPNSSRKRNMGNGSKISLSLHFLILLLALGAFNHFLGFIETKPGVQLLDPALARIPVHDVTWPIFIIIESL